MNIICVITCDRCGESPQSDPTGVDIFMIDDEFVAVARCPQCSHPITVWITRDRAVKIAKKGVKAFSYVKCEEISLDTLV